jgi:hypothetical protein
VTALNGTFTLKEVDDLAVMIGEDLELDVPRLLDETFHVERTVAEGGRRFPPRLRDRGRE